MVKTYIADRIVYLPPRRADVLSSASRQVAAVNPRRRALFIVNDSDEVIFLAIGQAAEAGRGIRLNAEGGAFNMTDDNLSTQAVYAIHGGTGVKNVTVQEANGMEEED